MNEDEPHPASRWDGCPWPNTVVRIAPVLNEIEPACRVRRAYVCGEESGRAWGKKEERRKRKKKKKKRERERKKA